VKLTVKELNSGWSRFKSSRLYRSSCCSTSCKCQQSIYNRSAREYFVDRMPISPCDILLKCRSRVRRRLLGLWECLFGGVSSNPPWGSTSNGKHRTRQSLDRQWTPWLLFHIAPLGLRTTSAFLCWTHSLSHHSQPAQAYYGLWTVLHSAS